MRTYEGSPERVLLTDGLEVMVRREIGFKACRGGGC
jgi:hypothetical protein